MYFTNNNFFHGIQFHHFHDNKLHKKTQGSIDKNDFIKLIKFIGRDNILDADEFYNRFSKNKLTEKKTCLTFDDSLRCQYDIALPVLEDLKIKSFFFIYSSALKGETDPLEVHRYFRTNFFLNIDEFYDLFFKKINTDLSKFFNSNKKKIKDKKIRNPFYSINDVKFRLIRDELLTKREYNEIMSKMFKEKKFNHKNYYKDLFMSEKNLVHLKKKGHLIGLHSHTHPTKLEELDFNEQFDEYSKNISVLSKILNCDKKEIKYMSHPCGSYNENTLKILKSLGIELGFKEVMDVDFNRKMKKVNNSSLEIARQNHADIIPMMNK